jgi:adenylate cyclase
MTVRGSGTGPPSYTGHSSPAKDRSLQQGAIALAPAAFDMYVRRRVPWQRPEDYAHMLEGLRKAGWEG